MYSLSLPNNSAFGITISEPNFTKGNLYPAVTQSGPYTQPQKEGDGDKRSVTVVFSLWSLCDHF